EGALGEPTRVDAIPTVACGADGLRREQHGHGPRGYARAVDAELRRAPWGWDVCGAPRQRHGGHSRDRGLRGVPFHRWRAHLDRGHDAADGSFDLVPHFERNDAVGRDGKLWSVPLYGLRAHLEGGHDAAHVSAHHVPRGQRQDGGSWDLWCRSIPLDRWWAHLDGGKDAAGGSDRSFPRRQRHDAVGRNPWGRGFS